MTKRPGFTLLELMVTIGVLAIVVGFAVPSYAAMQRSATLNSVAQDIADGIRIAQTRALSAQAGSDFQVNFYTTYLEIVTVATGSIETRPLEGGVTMSADQSSIVFERLSGFTDQAVNVTVSNGTNKTITVAKNGQISLP